MIDGRWDLLDFGLWTGRHRSGFLLESGEWRARGGRARRPLVDMGLLVYSLRFLKGDQTGDRRDFPRRVEFL